MTGHKNYFTTSFGQRLEDWELLIHISLKHWIMKRAVKVVL
jgi:hypothetical protein